MWKTNLLITRQYIYTIKTFWERMLLIYTSQIIFGFGDTVYNLFFKQVMRWQFAASLLVSLESQGTLCEEQQERRVQWVLQHHTSKHNAPTGSVVSVSSHSLPLFFQLNSYKITALNVAHRSEKYNNLHQLALHSHHNVKNGMENE